MEALKKLAESLYDKKPQETLFHYTSLTNFLSIINKNELWASNVRYFSDAGEMTYTLKILQTIISERLKNKILTEAQQKILNQLYQWLPDGLRNSKSLFVISFSTDGNLLSQWRAYCPSDKGISFGLEPNKLTYHIEQSSFQLGRCIYDEVERVKLTNDLIQYFVDAAQTQIENTNKNQRHPTQSFHDVFEEAQPYLLQIAALIKNPHFKEEREWRIVSDTKRKWYPSTQYREGKSFLIPYVKIKLPKSAEEKTELNQVYLGPTPNQDISMVSMGDFLHKQNVSYQRLYYCGIPYRT